MLVPGSLHIRKLFVVVDLRQIASEIFSHYVFDERFIKAALLHPLKERRDLVGGTKPLGIAVNAVKIAAQSNAAFAAQIAHVSNMVDQVVYGRLPRFLQKNRVEVYAHIAARMEQGAKLLGLDPKNCMVVEDADAGVEAALNGGMRVLGVGSASANPSATFTAASLADANFDEILK